MSQSSVMTRSQSLTANATTPGSFFKFLDLPAEVRLRIYDICATKETRYGIVYRSYGPRRRRWYASPRIRTEKLAWPTPVNLAKTCKQLYSEALPYAYSCLCFTVDMRKHWEISDKEIDQMLAGCIFRFVDNLELHLPLVPDTPTYLKKIIKACDAGNQMSRLAIGFTAPCNGCAFFHDSDEIRRRGSTDQLQAESGQGNAAKADSEVRKPAPHSANSPAASTGDVATTDYPLVPIGATEAALRARQEADPTARPRPKHYEPAPAPEIWRWQDEVVDEDAHEKVEDEDDSLSDGEGMYKECWRYNETGVDFRAARNKAMDDYLLQLTFAWQDAFAKGPLVLLGEYYELYFLNLIRHAETLRTGDFREACRMQWNVYKWHVKDFYRGRSKRMWCFAADQDRKKVEPWIRRCKCHDQEE